MPLQPARRQLVIGHANTYHDPAIAILEDGKIFAEAFERHTQCKRSMEMVRPWYSWRALRTALESRELWPVADADITVVGGWDHVAKLEKWEDESGPDWSRVPNDFPVRHLLINAMGLPATFENQLTWLLHDCPPNLVPLLPGMIPDDLSCTSKGLNHHLSHAANAAFCSPFDECLVLVLDGFGESADISLFHLNGNSLKPIDDQRREINLGFLYAYVTFICGFNPWAGEEWKVMGLAAFGSFRKDISDVLHRHTKIDGLNYDVDCGPIMTELYRLCGRREHSDPDYMKSADLAHTFQRWFEDVLFRVLQGAADLGISGNLAYGGGCALNSSANGKILANTDFERLFVPSAPGDDGNALGSALYERHVVRNEPREQGIQSPYLGSLPSEQKLDQILSLQGISFTACDDTQSLCEQTAELLCSGKIIGWMQGRAEFGPRALGNRSILADPRSPTMKDEINKRVKFREPYRPFAPSILHEYGSEYFEDYQESPYMERTLRFRSEVRDRVPAVVHDDGTGRLQTVRAEWNPLFHQLIEAFHQRAGVPLLLNTSLNVMGKPIVHSPEDAITVLFTTGLDNLVIGNRILHKSR